MTHSNARGRFGICALALIFALGLVLCGCGGGGGGGVAGSTDSPEALTGAADDAPTLVTGDPAAPVLEPGAPVTAMAMPSCPPAQGASANNSMNAFYTPANAFDGSMSTWWVGASGAGAWDLYYGFSTARQMESLNVTFYGTAYVPAQVRLKVSTDGCTWTDKGPMTGGSKPSAAVNQSVRYLWIEMTGNPGSGAPLVRDVDWVQPQDNAGASGGPGSNETFYFPANAFDGNISTWWVGKPGAGAWNIYYMFDTPRMVQMVTAYMYNLNYRPANMKLHISNDGQNWTDLGEMEPGGSPHQFVGQTTQYLWLEMAGNPPSNAPLIKDISFDIPTGASSGDSISSTYTPARAFDGNLSTWWAGAQGQTEWDLFYQYTTATAVSSADIAFYAATHAPADVTVYTSMDGDSWTTHGTVAGGANVSAPVGVTCKYLRLHLSGAPSVGYPVIRDITLQTAGTGVWMEVSPGSASGYGVSGASSPPPWPTVSMAGDAAGNTYVSWLVQSGSLLMSRWAAGSWTGLGGSDSLPGLALTDNYWQAWPNMDLAVSTSGIPYIAYRSTGGPNTIGSLYLSYWNGSAWDELGGSATGDGLAAATSAGPAPLMPAVTMNSLNHPIVAWIGGGEYPLGTGICGVYLKRWTGSSWEELGGSASGGGINWDLISEMGCLPVWPEQIDVMVDTSGNPIVAWSQLQPNHGFDLYIRRWNGTAWVGMGGSDTFGGVSNTSSIIDFSFAQNSQSAPTITWSNRNSSGLNNIQLKQWNGTAWVELGGSATGDGLAVSLFQGYRSFPSVILDSAGRPLVFWQSPNDYSSGSLYGKRWTGAAWQEMGGSATGTGIAPDIYALGAALNASGNPVVAYSTKYNSQDVVYVKQWVP